MQKFIRIISYPLLWLRMIGRGFVSIWNLGLGSFSLLALRCFYAVIVGPVFISFDESTGNDNVLAFLNFVLMLTFGALIFVCSMGLTFLGYHWLEWGEPKLWSIFIVYGSAVAISWIIYGAANFHRIEAYCSTSSTGTVTGNRSGQTEREIRESISNCRVRIRLIESEIAHLEQDLVELSGEEEPGPLRQNNHMRS